MRMVSVLVLVLLFVATVSGHATTWPEVFTYQQDGGASGDYFGYQVAGAGDVNGDGIDDYIIGAPLADPGGRTDAGSAYVYDGATGNMLYQKDGGGAGDQLGYAVAGAGDVNGDGYDDFIIGAPYAYHLDILPENGKAYVYSGATGGLLYEKVGDTPEDRLGWSVNGAGDLNGDGKDDFIVGACYTDHDIFIDAGSAYVYNGATGGLLYKKDGSAAFDAFGNSVAGAGDVNGDGRDDFIIGACYADPGGRSNAGSVYVFDGATGDLLYQKDGSGAGDNLGLPVAGAGDVNGDGLADFIIGAPYYGWNNAGSAYVYDGATGGLLYQKYGLEAGDHFGRSVARAGDVNEDGSDDFIVGARSADPGGLVNAGSAYVYDGATGTLLYQRDGSEGDRLGFSVAGAGDVNGDGTDDVIIGAWAADPGGMTDAGSAYILGPRTVTIKSIVDVPNDQGKQVRMRWRNNAGIGDSLMDLFIVYRRIDDGLSAGAKQLINDLGDLPPGDWEQVAVVAATGDSSYATVVPTLVDSTLTEGAQYSVFFVRGRSTNPLLYIDSPIDSVYSVDNLAPAPPLDLMAEASGPDAALDWAAVTDADFDFYWVYRDIAPGFTLDLSKRIGATSDTSYLDTSVPGSPVYYRVTAVDFAGNEGDPSNETSVEFCDCPFQCDYDTDGFLTSLDLGALIDVLFAGRSEEQDSNCPNSRGDFDCDGFPTALDLGVLIDHLFAGGAPPCDPCTF